MAGQGEPGRAGRAPSNSLSGIASRMAATLKKERGFPTTVCVQIKLEDLL